MKILAHMAFKVVQTNDFVVIQEALFYEHYNQLCTERCLANNIL